MFNLLREGKWFCQMTSNYAMELTRTHKHNQVKKTTIICNRRYDYHVFVPPPLSTRLILSTRQMGQATPTSLEHPQAFGRHHDNRFQATALPGQPSVQEMLMVAGIEGKSSRGEAPVLGLTLP